MNTRLSFLLMVASSLAVTRLSAPEVPELGGRPGEGGFATTATKQVRPEIVLAAGQPADAPLVRGAMIFPAKTPPPVLPAGYRLLYEQTFDQPDALRDFVMTDPQAWRVTTTNQQSALELVAQSKYRPPVRSPVNLALIADKVFGDFILEADLVQTGREYGHRDMCLFFGVQSPTNYYYAHIATAADPNAHNIFIVNGKPRTNIAKETTKGVNWGLGVWHRVRLVRAAAAGVIQVYFDDMTKPIMVAEDKHFATGYLGFGSFDDTGMVDNIKVWGRTMETKPTEFFQRPEK